MTAGPNVADLRYYGEMVGLHDHLPINTGLQSAQEATMVSILGPPQLPLTTHDQPDRASPLVKKLLGTIQIGEIRAHGIKPALESLQSILKSAFEREATAGHESRKCP